MYKLMISWNCGISYECERESDDVDSFKQRMAELDQQHLRYFVEDPDGNVDLICSIHKSIIETLLILNQLNKREGSNGSNKT